MNLVNWTLSQHGIEHFGFAKLEKPMSIQFYKNWLDKKYHAEMKYLEEHTELKESPQKLMNKAKSAIVVTFPYGQKKNPLPITKLKVAKYARDEDYHYWIKNKLNAVIVDLQKLYPQEEFIAFTDSAPVLERDLAYRAGLGWVGKNTCLIDRKKGSLFFIAEIYSSLELAEKQKFSPDHCGTCDRCITACPTQALEPDKTLNSHLCISYWTIEARTPPPVELRTKMGSWFFGCDICQDVCPWNLKIHDLTEEHPPREDLIQEVKLILQSSHKNLMKMFAKTPLMRAGGRGLKKNAILVAANENLYETQDLIKKYLTDPHLKELAEWSLNQLQKGNTH